MLQRVRAHPVRLVAAVAVLCVAAAAVLWLLDQASRVQMIEALAALVVVAAVVAARRLTPLPQAAGVAPATLRDVVLPGRTAGEVRALVGLLRSNRAVRRLGVEMPTGALLVGPPGTGKTLIARVIATEARRAFFTLDAASLGTPYAGQAAAWIRDVFAEARAQAPSVVFLDELDGIAASRRSVTAHGGEAGHDARRTVGALLAEVEGVAGQADVFVLGVTNHPDALDPAVRSRLSYVVHVDLPDLAARAEILRRHWPRRSRGIDPLTVALWTQNDRLSGRDCRDLVRAAGIQALARGGDAVEGQDFEAALRHIREARRAVRSGAVVGDDT